MDSVHSDMQDLELEKEFELEEGDELLQKNPVDDVVEVLDVEATEGDGGKNGKKRKLPPRPKLQSKDKKPSTRTPAKCWAHFEKIYEGGVLKWGECKYCKKRYAAETQKHGTSNLKESKGRAAGEAMEKRVTEIMRRLYDAYANASDVRVEAPRAMPSAMMTDDSNDPRLSLASRFKTFLEEECAGECESEVDKYLIHPCEPRKVEEKDKDFENLPWFIALLVFISGLSELLVSGMVLVMFSLFIL
ncbi:hypothetical protein Vadar_014158 [Vaccinium darrowii]|uniref:Uncharacterized protein n=1 Tax=Vaccinium darrowii TaxID=229202 RepID=A0ACB7XYU6_9ERIC|nr:hypothetical protein Vadar_014158 [Vaccinium darrowii]